MLSIVPPPPPSLSTAMALGVAGLSVAVGAAMLLWGRLLHRSFLAIAGAVIGVITASPLAERIGLPFGITGAVAILVFALVGAVAARLIWALAGGALFAMVVVGLVLPGAVGSLPPPTTTHPSFDADRAATDFTSWANECYFYLNHTLGAVWSARPAVLLWTICLGGGIPMVALLLLPRLGKIFMTSLVGALLTTGGLVLAIGHVHRLGWPSTWGGYVIRGGIALVLLVFSLVFQYCGDVAQHQADKQDEEDEAPCEKSQARSTKRSSSRNRKDKKDKE